MSLKDAGVVEMHEPSLTLCEHDPQPIMRDHDKTQGYHRLGTYQ